MTVLNFNPTQATSFGPSVCVGGTPMESGHYSSYAAANAFDSSSSGIWEPAEVASNQMGISWIGYDFGSPRIIRYVSNLNYVTAVNNISSVKIQYSDDSLAWFDCVTQSLSTAINVVLVIPLPLTSPHRYWRMMANANLTGSQPWAITDLRMFEYALTNFTTTYASQLSPDVTYGASSNLSLGHSLSDTTKAVFDVKIGSIPQGSAIKSATLSLPLTVQDLANAQVGDRLPVHYTAPTSGTLGDFYEWGTCSAAEIPTTGTATPDGKFHFIKVDKGLWIADRVIQTTLTWDTLNNTGRYINGNLTPTLRKIANPTTSPAGQANATAFSPDGVYMAIAHVTSPFVTIYKKSGDTFTKLANPDVLPTGQGNGVAFSPDGNYMAVAISTSPFIDVYKRNGDSFSKLPDPVTLPTGQGNAVAFSGDGNYLAIATQTSPYITIYQRSGDTLTKIADPATLPAGTGYSISFSPDSGYLTVGHATTPFVTIYKITSGTFAKLANPATLPPGLVNGVDFSSDGVYMATSSTIATYLTIYKRSGDTFTKLPDPAVMPSSSCYDVAFSPDTNYLVVGSSATTSPFLYRRSGDTFTRMDPPLLPPPNTVMGVAYSPDGNYLSVAAYNSAPYMATYKVNPQFFIRSLTGGVAYINNSGNPTTTNQNLGAWPQNNEWDKYIANSSLNGSITPGDNNVWHWNGLYTWCQETPQLALSANTTRILRGSPAANFLANSASSGTYCFRPVLEYPEN